MTTSTITRQSLGIGSLSSAPSWLKRIACITTSRADAGIYRPLLRAFADAGSWRVSLLAGGTHHDETFGGTGKEFGEAHEAQVFEVRHFVRGDSPSQVARSTGQAVIEFGRVLAQVKPDLVFVLGDRAEMLAAALAATIHRLPIAHLHGGDSTQGAIDDACRHAITKLAHLHFPALVEHGERIANMGEERWRIHAVGALALDAMTAFEPLTIEAVSSAVGVDFSEPTIMLAYYPETLSESPVDRQINEVLAGLHAWKGNVLLLGPNADVGHDVITTALSEFANLRPRTVLRASLPQEMFWSCLAHAAALVGNSSAGILESAGFRLPVVDIGDRQKGRTRAGNVVHASIHRTEIAAALARAVEPVFRQGLAQLANPYGDGRAAERIITAVRGLKSREAILRKQSVER